MNTPPSQPLSEAELDFLDETLLKYGNDDSILGVSELDGFLTAIVSGPETIMPSRWLPALWGGADKQPQWETEAEVQRFMSLVMQHMNFTAFLLMQYPQEFQALLNVNPKADPPILIAEEWCFGYMHGVQLGNWPELPEELDTWLQAIRLHGTEENFAVLGELSLTEHQQTVAEIEPAARKLHAYWLEQRTPAPMQTQAPIMPVAPFGVPPDSTPFQATANPLQTTDKIGRNDPCPCGSGKKFKQCCLH